MKGTKYIVSAFLLTGAICSAFLSGCESTPTANTKTESAVVTTEFQEDGSLLIGTEGLTFDVTFVDIKSGDTAMQLLARKGEDGTACISWNTCQVCNGSPYAYFEVEGGKLVCQNCGNSFSLDSIGESSGGCFPWPVDESVVSDDTIIIPAQTIESMEPLFSNWKQGI